MNYENKNYHIQKKSDAPHVNIKMYPEMVEDRFVLSCITFDCVECTEQLDKACINGEIFITNTIFICNKMSVPLYFSLL